MKTNVERVGPMINLEIDGRPPMIGITYAEAMRALDEAYTEELRGAVERVRALCGLLSGAETGLLNLCDELENRHLGGPRRLEEKPGEREAWERLIGGETGWNDAST